MIKKKHHKHKQIQRQKKCHSFSVSVPRDETGKGCPYICRTCRADHLVLFNYNIHSYNICGSILMAKYCSENVYMVRPHKQNPSVGLTKTGVNIHTTIFQEFYLNGIN